MLLLLLLVVVVMVLVPATRTESAEYSDADVLGRLSDSFSSAMAKGRHSPRTNAGARYRRPWRWAGARRWALGEVVAFGRAVTTGELEGIGEGGGEGNAVCALDRGGTQRGTTTARGPGGGDFLGRASRGGSGRGGGAFAS